MNKFSLFTLLILITFSCKTNNLGPDQYNKQKIVFGSGGGFAGAYNEYTLLEDGRLFQRNKDKNAVTEIKTLNKKFTQQIFSNIKTFGLDKKQHNEPQNLYYFLKYKSPKDSSNIVWSGQPNGDLNSANSIYKILVEQTKNSNK